MFGLRRRIKREEAEELEKEVKELRQKLIALKKEKEELEKKLRANALKVRLLRGRLASGKHIVVFVPYGRTVVKLKGKITPGGILVRWGGEKKVLVWHEDHVFYVPGRWGSAKLAVYADPERGVTLPPPSSTELKGVKEISGAAVSAVLQLYRTIVLGKKFERSVLMVAAIIAIASLVLAAYVIYQQNVTVRETMQQVATTIEQLKKLLESMSIPAPAAPSP